MTRGEVRLPLQLSPPLPPSSEEPLVSGAEGIKFRETFSSRVGETEAETNRHSLTLNNSAHEDLVLQLSVSYHTPRSALAHRRQANKASGQEKPLHHG
jgi:hypothetical protein